MSRRYNSSPPKSLHGVSGTAMFFFNQYTTEDDSVVFSYNLRPTVSATYKVYLLIDTSSSTVSSHHHTSGLILKHVNPFHILTFYLFNIQFNILLPSTKPSSNWPLSLRYFHKIFFKIYYACNISPSPPHLTAFD
jgi:hypothetical protein